MRAEASDSSSFPVWPVLGGASTVLVLGGLARVAAGQRRARLRA